MVGEKPVILLLQEEPLGHAVISATVKAIYPVKATPILPGR